jgi:F-type H+-transporting ATPase subunit delta
MRGASRESLTAAQDRLQALMGQAGVDPAVVGDELFSVADLLDGQPAVRASLTDPSRSGDDKAALVRSLLAGKLGEQVVEFVEGTVRGRWSANRDLADAVDTLAVDSVLTAAQQQGRLDSLEDELFRFSRVVSAEPTLRAALTDRALPATNKAQLVAGLLQGKVGPETVRLATRTVTHPRGRSLEAGLAALADMAAARRQRLVATVTAATPLTEEQRERLTASLAAKFGHSVHVNVVVDPEVVGGLRVSLGDEVIDGSLATRIEEARRRITG